MKPNINDTNTCYVCGAREIATTSSLHVWLITYECGCRIWGAISSKEVEVDNKCPWEQDGL